MWEFWKLATFAKIPKIYETVLLQNSIPNVNKKGIYFIRMRLKNRKAALKKLVIVAKFSKMYANWNLF